MMIVETFFWWLAAEFLGMAAFPIVEKSVGSALRDGGYSVSKIFGMIFVTYAVWIMAGLKILKYDAGLIALAVGALLAVSASLFDKSRHVPILRKHAVKIDVLFTLAFLFFVLVRAYNPDIGGAEKPMDFAILNSIGRSEYFPPQDSWFSGRTLPYYYMGHLSASVLDKLTGTNSTVASYNLAVAIMFALAATAAFGIGYNLTGKNSGGLLAVFLVLLAGNLSSVLQFLGYMPSGQEALFSWDYWKASRVITDTINEFPYFTFLHADLHAHLFSVPVQLLLVSMALGTWLSGSLSIPIVALSLGYLIPLHSWDYPLYLALILATAALVSVDALKKAVAAAAGSVLLYVTFLISYGSRSLGIALSAKHSPLPQFFMVYGAFMVVIYLFLFSGEERNNKTLRASGIAVLAMAVFLQNSLLAMVPMALLSASRIPVSRDGRDARQFAVFLALAGSLVAVFMEAFYIVDGMPPPWERMNTVFRLGEVAWIFLALASAFCLSELFSKYKKWKPLGLAAMLLLSAFFIFATGSRTGWFSHAPPPDGTSWMAEKASIDWLNKNVKGQPVILEAPGRDYELSSRVSSATGLPTLIGWPGHEVHWRQGSGIEINERIADTDRIYSTTDLDEAKRLLGKYGAKYVFVGNEERKKYPEAGLDKFARHFQLEYSDSLVQIYGST